MTIGERFKAVRLEHKTADGKKLTQEAFAKTIGMTRDTLANVENDRNPPTEAVIQLVCERYNINNVWLRAGNGEMFRPLKQDKKLAEMMKAIDATDESSDGERFRRAVVMALARITPEQWDKIAEEANRLFDDYKV